MRMQSFLFLIIGFAAGYGVVFTWTKERAPELVRTTMRTPADQGPAGGFDSRPPVDMAVVKQLQDRVKQNPGDFEALKELGNINFDQQNFNDAINLYTKALDVEPNNVNVRIDLGTTYFYAQRFDDAIAEFRKSLALDPSHPQALFNLGVAFLHGKNDAQSAIQSWERLIALNPNYPQISLVKEQLEALKEQLKK